ncbi:FAS1 domain-containing protein [Dichomitus squalens]|uniref:FAS1 domain-containing protein n=1 Tax=Dichomitus squalens TaxID=114155 RepID=A0A4Q9MMP8_9APHY|nr:FAS1 domain-containing protein [Dichomitus squalens]
MLLLHTVLAVVYSGLLAVSARPEYLGRFYDAEGAELTDASEYSYYYRPQHEASQAAGYENPPQWSRDASQQILGAHREYAEEGYDGQEPARFPGTDHGRRPEPPHHFPPPPPHFPEPHHEFPKPPHPFPEPPHYPPPEPHHPHGPPEGPPKKGPFPHFPMPDHHKTKDKTIYQFLESHPKFSRLFKLVNYTEDITNLLNDSSQSVTFFALPDWAFPKPPHHHGVDGDEDAQLEELFQTGGDLSDMLAAAEGYLSSAHKPDEDKIKQFLKYLLLYNILPEQTPLHQLRSNHTHATSLKLEDGSLDGEQLRIRVGKGFGADFRPTINFGSKVLVPDIPTKNGAIHVVSKPILPPPSVFQIAFLFSDAFSIFSSAIQRVGLTDELDFHGGEDGSGTGAVSIFAPHNKAFSRLPPRLKFYLFSPFGQKALKKLLQFHIVPDAVLHSNYYHNASESEFVPCHHDVETNQFYAHLDPYSQDWSIPEESRGQEYAEVGYVHEKYGWFKHDGGRPELQFPPPPPPPHIPPPPEDLPPPPPPRSRQPQHPPPPRGGGPDHPHHPPPGDEPHHPPHHPPPRPPPPPKEGHHHHLHLPRPDVVYKANATVPTLLEGHPLEVKVVQLAFKSPFGGEHHKHAFYKTVVVAHGQPVTVPDVPARNGAIHVVTRLLNPLKKPRHHHGHEFEGDHLGFGPFLREDLENDDADEWAGWEEWLPRWAEE